MPIEIITVFITVGLNGAFWFLQRHLNKRKESAEIEKTEADTDNVDSETIQNLVEGMGKLDALYENQLTKNALFAEKNARLHKKVVELERSYKEIVEQNRLLIKENAEMNITLRELKRENESLRRLIISDKIEKADSGKDIKE